MPIEKNSSFSSSEDFIYAIREYEKTNYCQLYVRDSKSISRLKCDREINPNIKHRYLKYTCLMGGKNFKSSAKTRLNQKTYRQKCPFYIKASYDKLTKKLIVTDINSNHNHLVSNFAYKHLPRQRKIGGEECEKEIKSLLKNKTSKKCIQNHILESRGQLLLRKDITNISSRMKTEIEVSDCEYTIPDKPNSQKPKLAEYNKALSLLKGIATLVSESPHDIYVERMNVLKALRKAWRNGEYVSLAGLKVPSQFSKCEESLSRSNSTKSASLNVKKESAITVDVSNDCIDSVPSVIEEDQEVDSLLSNGEVKSEILSSDIPEKSTIFINYFDGIHENDDTTLPIIETQSTVDDNNLSSKAKNRNTSKCEARINVNVVKRKKITLPIKKQYDRNSSGCLVIKTFMN